ncbi:MAG TPA: hypothetical protein PKV41_04635, partial [Candidatus Omnitrophota bacterium]|nr:hypothetical protein [Candidatus Omnitrophota bacterium]
MSEWFYKRINWLAGYLAIAVLFGLVVLSSNIEIKDVDLWLHLAVGRHILQTFSIPRADFLSCTIAQAPWIDHEWLFQVLVRFIYDGAGIQGLIGLKAGVIFFLFVLLLFLGYTRERQSGPVGILLLVLLIFQRRMTLRPDLFSLLFFVLYIVILNVHVSKRWSLWAIALIQMIWTNMHGFFILGPALVFVVFAGEKIKRSLKLPFAWNERGRLTDAAYKRLAWMLPVVCLACLANPYLLEGVWYPLKVFFSLAGDSRIFFSHIQELERPLAWGNLFSWHPQFYYKLLMLVSFLSFLFNYRKIDITALLLWGGFLLFS